MARYYATPEGRVAFTAAEETARDAEEKEWADSAPTRAFKFLREERDTKLAKSDYMGNSDVTMSDAWKAYRKKLRDLPGTLDDTTVLETITWPDEPE
jgi:hypothetical protein